MQCKSQNLTDRCHNSIDLFKLVMAFAVVAIHTRPLDNCTNRNLLTAYDLAVGMAVPFFFLASGYLLAIKMSWPYTDNVDNANRVLKQLKKITQMYLTWTAVYFPLAVYRFISTRTAPMKAVLLYIQGFLFIGEQYNSWQLWYLLSTIYALLVIYILLIAKKSSSKHLIILSIVASVFSVGISNLVAYEGKMPFVLQVIQEVVRYSISNGRILTGMIYLPIGMLLARKQIPFVFNVIVFTIGYAANFYIGSYIVKNYLRIVMSIALFGVVESIKLKNSTIYPRLRSMSTMIYFTHMWIWTFYYKIFYRWTTYSIDCFLVTSAIAVLLFFAVDYIKDKKFPFMNKVI